MRSLRALALLALFAPALAAQDQQRPDGWQMRFDSPGASEADLQTFVEMPPGWHVTTGPAGIFWGAEMEATGQYKLELEVFLFDPGARREAFGVFLGGRNLQAADQEYTYFLIRNGGQFILKRREGTQAPTLQGWTAHDAIRSYADRGDDSSVRNVLTVEAGAETVRFLVNGEQVARLPRSEVGVDGTFGLRVNHALNLHVSRLEVTRLD